MDDFEVDFTSELEVASLSELISNLDSNWEIGKKMLYSGFVERKLYALNEEALVKRTREIKKTLLDQNVGLETFLREIGGIQPPSAKLVPDFFEVDTVESSLTVKFTIQNAGRGYLIGEISSDTPWARPNITQFSGNRLHVSVDVDLSMIQRGQEGRAVLTVSGGREPVQMTIKVRRRGIDLALSLYNEKKYLKAAQICDTIIQEQPGQSDATFLQALCHFREGNARDAFTSLFLVKTIPQSLPPLHVKDLFFELEKDEVFYPNLNRVIEFYERLLPHLTYDYRELVEGHLAESYLRKAVILWDIVTRKRDLSLLILSTLAHNLERSPIFHNFIFPLIAFPLSLVMRLMGRELTEERFVNKIGGLVFYIDKLVEKSRLLSPSNLDWSKFTRILKDERRELIRKGAVTLALDISAFILFVILFFGYRFQKSNDLYEQGVSYLRKGAYDKAVACFEKSMDEGFRYTACMLKLSDAHQLWARDCARSKDFFSAVEHYNLSLKHNPLNKESYKEKMTIILEWGINLLNTRQYREAYKKFDLLLTLQRDNSHADKLKRKTLFMWANDLCDKEDYPGASEILSIIERNYIADRACSELKVKIYLRWGMLLVKEHRIDEALLKLTIARDEEPDNVAVLGFIARYEPYRNMIYVEGKGQWKIDLRNPEKKYYVAVPSFYIDRYEVTNEQFLDFAKAKGYMTELERKSEIEKKGAGGGTVSPDLSPGSKVKGDRSNEPLSWRHYAPLGREKHPVITMTLEDALAYCTWAHKRLPSQEQWELAGGYSERSMYPWGDGWDRNKCNGLLMYKVPQVYSMADILNGRGTLPVGSLPEGNSAIGCSDMSGNVGEWIYSDSESTKNLRVWVLAGGGWNSKSSQDLRTNSYKEIEILKKTSRVSGIENVFLLTGFRCVKDIP
jgi:formylglycine-generating enzyme required for sulfatase activity